jgi:lysine 2,3-aminomutase
MTSSAGKISMLGTMEINGEKVFALKFNEGRNMEWLDTVYLAKYDETENTIEKLKPYGTSRFFYEDELIEIENKLHDALENRMKSNDQSADSIHSCDNRM